MTTDTDRSLISQTLRREASTLARAAAQKLIPHLDPLFSSVHSGSTAEGEATGAISRDPEVLNRMVEDGFGRLGELMAFALAVDEPGIIADDLEWLHNMFAKRGMPDVSHAWMENLVRAYVASCEAVLNAAQLEVVRDISERGLVILRERRAGSGKDGS